jgi:hypothetical protein
MTSRPRRILGHLRGAFVSLTAASRLARAGSPLEHAVAKVYATAAVQHLVEAATLISPAAGARVAAAAERAFADAHRRVAARRADAYADGLDESGAASGAPEGTGGLVVDMAAQRADEERLHGAEGTSAVYARASEAAWVAVQGVRQGMAMRAEFDAKGTVGGIARVIAGLAEAEDRRYMHAVLAELRVCVFIADQDAMLARREWRAVVEAHGQHGEPAAHVRSARVNAKRRAAAAHRACNRQYARMWASKRDRERERRGAVH